MSEIKKVAVIGAGVMGSGIAAQITNAGLPVLLLDRYGLQAESLEAASGRARNTRQSFGEFAASGAGGNHQLHHGYARE